MSERLTDAQIEELLALEAAITEGPWDENEENGVPFREVFAGNQVICDTGVSGLDAEEVGANNRFIAASRNSIRSLLEEVRASRKAIAAVQALELTQQSPIGPLHGAGIADGLQCAKDTMKFELARAEKEGKNR